MKKLFLFTVASVALLSFPAKAAEVLIEPDPLHGACTGCTAANIGGNDVTVIGPNGVSAFGFTSSPAGATGDFQLKVLIPNSYTLAQVQAFDAGVNVTNNGSTFDLGLYSTTPWTAGFLETDYLGNTLANGAPKNPLDAWIGATNAVLTNDATGYYVLTAQTGAHVLGGQSDALSLLNTFGLDPAVMALGGFIVGNMFTSDGVISTAQSSALFFTGPSGGPFCATPPCVAPPPPPSAVPIPGVGMAMLPMIGAAGWYARRRRRTALAG
jgi:opacity protein-like surface antigen